MSKEIWREYRKILVGIYEKYGDKVDSGKIEYAAMFYAGAIFFSMEEEEVNRLFVSEEAREQYRLMYHVLKFSQLASVKKYDTAGTDLYEHDFKLLKETFEQDFESIYIYSSELARTDDRSTFTIDSFDSMVDREGISVMTTMEMSLDIAMFKLYKTPEFNALMSWYQKRLLDQTSKPVKEEIDNVINLRAGLKKQLKAKIKGQDLAIDKFVDGFMRYKMRGTAQGKPAAVYLFAGPPGTGKTYLAESFAEIAADQGYKYKRFDMSAFGGTGSDAITGLVGFEKTWKAAQPGLLTDFVHKNPKCVLLFDEIEKASQQVRLLFLSVLEGAVLTDRYYDRAVSFEEAIIIFTTNEGKDLYADNRKVNLTAMSDSAVIDGLQDSQFPPELLSRFMSGNVIMFNHLEYRYMLEIFSSSVDSAVNQIRQNSIDFTFKYNRDILPKMYLFNKGSNIDARFVSSNAKKQVEDYFLQSVEYVKKSAGNLKGLKTVSALVDVGEEFRDYFNMLNKPRILGYKTCEVYENGKSISQIADIEWVTDVEEFKTRLRQCNWNSKNSKDKYNAILINMFNDAGEELRQKYTDSDGYKCLQIAVEERRQIPIMVVDKMHTQVKVYGQYENRQEELLEGPIKFVDNTTELLKDNEKMALLASGVTDFISGKSRVVNKDWKARYYEGSQYDLMIDTASLTDVLRRHYFVEKATELAENNQKLSGDVTYVYSRKYGELKIRFTNLRVEKATEENAESRQQNRRYLLANRPEVRLDDIFGNVLPKEAVKRCIDNIRYPDKYKAAGAKLMKGILMYGAPGMGKTMFAKAMAFESGADFISAVGSDFLKNDGVTKMEEIFETARRKKPCIIFIDEFDAISRNRNGAISSMEEHMLDKFLKEMDGVESNNEGVYVVGATNYSLEALDEAIVRRFSAKIHFPYPNLKERLDFILYTLQKKGLKDVLSERAAKTLNLMMYSRMRSFAEIENFIEESIAEALYNNRPVTERFLFNRVQNEISGAAREMDEDDNLVPTAFHEAGHAVLQWYFGRSNDYVTIVARGGYGGYAMAKAKYYSGQDYLNQISISFAGRAAELIYFNKASSLNSNEAINIGASSDLQKATERAYEYICRFGFGNRFSVVPDSFASRGSSYPEEVLPESEKEAIWKEVDNILEQEWERTQSLLTQMWGQVSALAISLVYMKELDGEAVEEIIRTRVPRVEESCFLDSDNDYAIHEALKGADKIVCPQGYPVYPRSMIKSQVVDVDMVDAANKKYYYTVKTDAQKLGIYNDLQEAFEVAFHESASCRRFERYEAAQQYMQMLELKVARHEGEEFVGLKVDAADELQYSSAPVNQLIILKEDEIHALRETAAENDVSLVQYLIEYLGKEYFDNCVDDFDVVFQIYDEECQKEIIEYLDKEE